jgi:hypothetical protein
MVKYKWKTKQTQDALNMCENSGPLNVSCPVNLILEKTKRTQIRK